jgi:hypothetical protein
MVMFGGFDVQDLGDTWTYNLTTNNWTDMHPPTGPSARSNHAIAYDSVHDEIVLFGGEGSSGQLGDTWTYDQKTNNWTDMAPSGGPSARSGHAMVYDRAHGEVVLFGGYLGYYLGYKELGDTWTYNLSKNSWTNMTPSVSPPARGGHSMAYDSARGEVLLFSGRKYSYYYFNDTWAYNLTTNKWINENPTTTPPGRCHHAMVYDSSHDDIIMFGGFTGPGLILFCDTWTYSHSANNWMNMTPSIEPSARYGHGMVYDPAHGIVMLFGGETGYGDGLGDTYTYDPIMNNWTLNPPTAPVARGYPALAYDSAHGEVVLFGGSYYEASYNYFYDTWTYNLTSDKWTNMNPPIAPPAGYQPAMVYDNIHDKVVLFNGEPGAWTYDLSTNNWTNMNPPTAPSTRSGHAMAYDSGHDKVVLFGGKYSSDLGDTWTYDLRMNNWTNMAPSTAPSARSYHAMAYDSAHGEVVLFGGMSGINSLNDTWTYNLSSNNWTNMKPPNAPSVRSSHAMAYDSARNEVVLFGGFEWSYGLADTWTYNLTANNWTKIDTSTTPPARYGNAMVYDSSYGETVVFGGYGGYEENPILNDIWTYNTSTYSTIGNHTSSPHDAGGTAYFGTISWDIDTPPNTSIRFQFRSADTKENLTTEDFIGPDGTVSSFYIISGAGINPMNNHSRWFQYRAYLGTNDINFTPVLHSVTVDYNLLQNVNMLSPVGGEVWNGIQTISWNASDADNDQLLFDIHLIDSTGKTAILATNLTGHSWQWNTSSTVAGPYKIRVIARDDNPSIPLITNVTSGDLTIDRPPHVGLESPLNNSLVNSTSVRLLWQGFDPDGDSLTYTVRHSDRPFSQGTVLNDTTADDYFDITDMVDNGTYYWTVDATDGKADGTDIPTEVWSFTVRLPPPPPINHPPRFTSIPSTIAWVGKEYVYNLTSMDEDGDIPIFSIVSAPANLTLNSSTGQLRWTPTTPDIGNHTITIQVSDGRGSFDRQTFTITVMDVPIQPKVPPKCAITYPINGTKLNGIIQIRGTAMNGSLPMTAVRIRLDGDDWMTAIGLDSWTFALNSVKLTNGKHHVEAKAFDANLSSETASAGFTVNNPAQSTSTGGNPWCLPAIIVALAAGTGAILFVKRKRMSNEK